MPELTRREAVVPSPSESDEEEAAVMPEAEAEAEEAAVVSEPESEAEEAVARTAVDEVRPSQIRTSP